jgi:hypothetical protein
MNGDWAGLPPLDADERAELDRLRARYRRDPDDVPPLCPDCGHVHASPAFGSICVGCPCLSVPGFVGRRR